MRTNPLLVILLSATIGVTSVRADWESILKNASQSGSHDSSSTESPIPKRKKPSQPAPVSETANGVATQNQVESFVPKYKAPKIDSSEASAGDTAQISLPPGQPKEALLIANGDYAHFGKLPNPVGDAKLLVNSLQQIGFKVTLVQNASRESMLEALQTFQDSLKVSHAVALFHYGGHGVQVDGHNYLIPADADIPDERKVTTRAVDLDEVMTTLDASSSCANVVILDACRDNPLPAMTRSATRGLTVVQSKPKNSLIIFAAEAGSRANDGLFTPTLANAITKPGKSLSQIMKEVRKEVFSKSNGTQTPGEYDQLFEDLYLYSVPNNQPPAENNTLALAATNASSSQPQGTHSISQVQNVTPPPNNSNSNDSLGTIEQGTRGQNTPSSVSVAQKYYVTGLDPNGDNWLALKSAPDLKASRLRKLPPDTPLTPLARQGEWIKVSLDDGQEGWVFSKYVRAP